MPAVCDVSDTAQVRAMVDDAIAELGNFVRSHKPLATDVDVRVGEAIADGIQGLTGVHVGEVDLGLQQLVDPRQDVIAGEDRDRAERVPPKGQAGAQRDAPHRSLTASSLPRGLE